MGKTRAKIPQSLAEFIDLKYNNKEEFKKLQGFKEYRRHNPETQISLEEYQTVVNIKEIGLKGEPNKTSVKGD